MWEMHISFLNLTDHIVVIWIFCHGGFAVTPILSVTHCWASEQDTCHWDKSQTSSSYTLCSISSGFGILTNNRHRELKAHTIDFTSRLWHFVFFFIFVELIILSSLFICHLSGARFGLWWLALNSGNILVQSSFFLQSQLVIFFCRCRDASTPWQTWHNVRWQ